MTDTEDPPTMTVSTEHVEIEVVDRQTAEMALDIVDEVLGYHLGQTSDVDAMSVRRKPPRVEYDAECPECGNQWRRKARNDQRATCPQCNHSWTHDVRGRDRPDAEVVDYNDE